MTNTDDTKMTQSKKGTPLTKQLKRVIESNDFWKEKAIERRKKNVNLENVIDAARLSRDRWQQISKETEEKLSETKQKLIHSQKVQKAKEDEIRKHTDLIQVQKLEVQQRNKAIEELADELMQTKESNKLISDELDRTIKEFEITKTLLGDIQAGHSEVKDDLDKVSNKIDNSVKKKS